MPVVCAAGVAVIGVPQGAPQVEFYLLPGLGPNVNSGTPATAVSDRLL